MRLFKNCEGLEIKEVKSKESSNIKIKGLVKSIFIKLLDSLS